MPTRSDLNFSGTPMPADANNQAWNSWHLYEVRTGDYYYLLSAAIRPALAQVLSFSLANSFFFIRYRDAEGPHVRLRLRLADNDPGTAQQAERIIERSAALQGLRTIGRIFEPETERYGGAENLPLTHSFFCLSSFAALEWCHHLKQNTRPQVLLKLLDFLAIQAAAFSRDLNELSLLFDYFAGWRSYMRKPILHGDSIFERQADGFVSRLKLNLETLRLPHCEPKYLIEGARALSTATLHLHSKLRYDILSSHMHMISNRMGLLNAEESYITHILKRSLDGLLGKDSDFDRQLGDWLGAQQTTTTIDGLVNRCIQAQ